MEPGIPSDCHRRVREVPLQPQQTDSAPAIPDLHLSLQAGRGWINCYKHFIRATAFPTAIPCWELTLVTFYPALLPPVLPTHLPQKQNAAKPRGAGNDLLVFPPKTEEDGGQGDPRGPSSCRKLPGGGGVQAFHPITPGSPSPARPDVGCLIFLQFCFNTHTILGAGSLSHFLQGVALPFKYFRPLF